MFLVVAAWVALLLPAGAWAQTPYTMTVRSQAFQPLPVQGGTATSIAGGDFIFIGTNVFPPGFSIMFFDEPRNAMYLDAKGYATFINRTSSASANQVIPSGTDPNDLIAVLWDDMISDFKTQVIGEAPSRTFIVEFEGYRWATGSSTAATYQAQIWLYEGSSTIEIHYGDVEVGTAGWNASMGIEDSTGQNGYQIPSAATGNDCGSTCTPADVHTQSVVTFSQGPELNASAVSAPVEGFAGISMPMSATATNVGGEPAVDFTVRFWVSPTSTFGDRSIELVTLDGDVRSLEPQESTVFHAEPRLPIELEQGQYYIHAELDPHHVVPVSSRGQTVGVYGPFAIGIRAPNLAVGWVDGPELVRPGETVELSWLAENTGNLATVEIEYRVTLSPTMSVSPASLEIGAGMIDSLGMQEELVERTEVTIPESLEPGLYHIGVQIDPRRRIFEHERRDNVGISSPILVSNDHLVIVSESLPLAHYQGHYDVRLLAVGGYGSPEWKVKDGSILPPGLSLETETANNGQTSTFLRGVPAKKGAFSFTLQARSGQVEAEQTFELEVGGGAYSLTVVTENLAEAAFGLEYEDRLAGSGGIPPYTWELVGGTELPQGVFLRADGYLSGRPQEGGDFPLTFRLTDSQGLQTTKEVNMVVAPPNSLTCVTKELPILQLGEFVRIPLIAAGGPTNSYSWSTVSTVRLVSNIGESSTTLLDPPPGLRLDQGTVVGEPASVGTYLWTLRVTADSASTECPILINVPSDHGLSVTTSGLPLAIAGRSYRAALDVAGGEGPYTWEFLDEQLAEALNMVFEAGSLVGTPPLEALGGEKERAFSFTVRVEDTKGRIGIGALTLQLVEKGLRTGAPAAEDDGGGCQTSSDGASLWGLALLGLVLLRRSRRA